MSIRHSKRFESLLATGALTAGLLGGSIAVAPSAAAWPFVGHCSGSAHWHIPHYSLKVPVTQHQGLPNVACWMDHGSTGNGVRILQRALKECYNRSIAVDGVFGNGTRNALVYAQGQENIATDGLYGEQSHMKLKWPRYSEATGSRQGCGSRS